MLSHLRAACEESGCVVTSRKTHSLEVWTPGLDQLLPVAHSFPGLGDAFVVSVTEEDEIDFVHHYFTPLQWLLHLAVTILALTAPFVETSAGTHLPPLPVLILAMNAVVTLSWGASILTCRSRILAELEKRL